MKSKRVPVYKDCPRCGGDGGLEIRGTYPHEGGQKIVEVKQACTQCDGTGKIKTEYFIEVT